MVKIDMPADQKFIPVPFLIWLIVEHLEPNRKIVPFLKHLQKQAHTSQIEEELNQEDKKLLATIWKDVTGVWPLSLFGVSRNGEQPRGNSKITMEDFGPFAEAFKSFPENPGWDLVATQVNHPGPENKRQIDIKRAQKSAIEQASVNGLIKLYNNLSVTTHVVEHDTLMPFEDAKKYLERLPPGFELNLRLPLELQKVALTLQSATSSSPSRAKTMAESCTSAISSTKNRRNILTPVIELAQSKCRSPYDTAAVWAALQILAEKKEPPLLGATEDGIQYLKNGFSNNFSRENLRKRLTRSKSAPSKNSNGGS